MKCQSCDKILSDKEAGRKFSFWREMKNPEERYIGLCDVCLKMSEVNYVEDPLQNDNKYVEGEPLVLEDENE